MTDQHEVLGHRNLSLTETEDVNDIKLRAKSLLMAIDGAMAGSDGNRRRFLLSAKTNVQCATMMAVRAICTPDELV